MVTPLGHGVHPHFKLPQAQGWALKCYDNAAGWLEKAEAKRTRHRRRRDGRDPDRVQDVRKTLGSMLTEVAVGSELLYHGLPASSLDGQPLAIAIEAHLARPAIPAATELFHGLCAAAGLCLERAGCALRKQVKALREQAAAVQAAVERSWSFWRTTLDGVPKGCRRPLSLLCRWRRRAGIEVGGCASASRLGSRRLRMRQWRPVAALLPCVDLESHARRHVRLSGPLGPLWALPRSLAAPFIRVQQVHASTRLGRLCGGLFQLSF